MNSGNGSGKDDDHNNKYMKGVCVEQNVRVKVVMIMVKVCRNVSDMMIMMMMMMMR